MARLLTPMAKFWICKRGSHFAQEAMECLGGNGYVEEGGEGIMARIYREMPLNSIWEGAGNIMAIDLLRAICASADAAAALAHELAPARGAHPALDRLAAALPMRVEEMATRWRRAAWRRTWRWPCRPRCCTRPHRRRVRRVLRLAPGGNWGQAFGTLGAGTDFDSILTRAQPR
jgi:putative acyl-CoA dehydrogenase